MHEQTAHTRTDKWKHTLMQGIQQDAGWLQSSMQHRTCVSVLTDLKFRVDIFVMWCFNVWWIHRPFGCGLVDNLYKFYQVLIGYGYTKTS